MAGVLCDLVCGRRFLPAVRKCSASRAMLYSSASRSTYADGGRRGALGTIMARLSGVKRCNSSSEI